MELKNIELHYCNSVKISLFIDEFSFDSLKAEVFDPRTKDWRMIATMSTRRSSVGVGVVKHLLYAVGGNLEYNFWVFNFVQSLFIINSYKFKYIGYDGASRQCLASVERYEVQSDTWTQFTEMTARRSGAGVGVLDNILYAVGGHDGPLVSYRQPTQSTRTKYFTILFVRR